MSKYFEEEQLTKYLNNQNKPNIKYLDKEGKGAAGKTSQEMKKKTKKLFKAGGGLAEATAKLKAKGFSEGGAVMKDKTVAMDKSPNSGLITQRGFGASRRT